MKGGIGRKAEEGGVNVEWPKESAEHYAIRVLLWHPVTARKAIWAVDEDGQLVLMDSCGNWESVRPTQPPYK